VSSVRSRDDNPELEPQHIKALLQQNHCGESIRKRISRPPGKLWLGYFDQRIGKRLIIGDDKNKIKKDGANLSISELPFFNIKIKIHRRTPVRMGRIDRILE
jgi:hypothetical protein